MVDVVVTDRNGNPIAGLDKGDFTVLEDGKVQPLQVFEPHVPVKQMAVPDLVLPPGEFTNFPKQVSNSAVNVVLFDILNTPTDDQLFARQEMIEFLKTLPRGQRVALFTLGYDLKHDRRVHHQYGRSDRRRRKVKPGVSALLDTEQDMAAEDHMNNQLLGGMSPSSSRIHPRPPAAVLAALRSRPVGTLWDPLGVHDLSGSGQFRRCAEHGANDGRVHHRDPPGAPATFVWRKL